MGSKFLPGEFVMVKGDLNSGTSDVVFQIKQVFQKFVSYYKKQVQAVSQFSAALAGSKVEGSAIKSGRYLCITPTKAKPSFQER